MAIFNSTQARTNKSNSPRAKKRLDRSTFVVPGLVNRQRVIATLKIKLTSLVIVGPLREKRLIEFKKTAVKTGLSCITLTPDPSRSGM